MTAVLIQATPDSRIGFECYGAHRDFWRSHEPEILLVGAYETGKTVTALQKLNALLGKYSGAQALMVRQTYNSLIASAVRTYEDKVLPYPPSDPRCVVKAYGGKKPEWYDYPNGSRLVLGGMDNASKFLSSEWDYIYINQLEELTIDSHEQLTGRCTGRAGHVPYHQLMADCNPGSPAHWILKRDRLKKFITYHRDNPRLYNQETGEITEAGKLSLATLQAMTGVRYKRGFEGKWAGVEGQVYEEYSEDIHLITLDKFYELFGQAN